MAREWCEDGGGWRSREQERETVSKGRATRTKEDVVGGRLRREPSRPGMWESLILYVHRIGITTFDHLNRVQTCAQFERDPSLTRADIIFNFDSINIHTCQK